MRTVLRVGLLSLLALLVLTALGGGALAARNLFDDDYQDCPAGVRVASLTGVKAVRTDKDDELKVEWNAAPWASWNLHGATAEITVQVQSKDRTKTLQAANKALGATSTTFTKVDLATDWVIQVAVTDRKKVISDIVEVEFTSGVQKPLFFTGLYWAGPTTGGHTTAKPSSGPDTSVDKAADKVGEFYYLGFNKYFDNWYVEGALETYDRNDSGAGTDDVQPNIAKFRVGLRHGVTNPGDADFDHFRIRVEDESGDNVLGFDAETVVDSFYPHGTKELALRSGLSWKTHPGRPRGLVSNVALSNRVTDDGQRVDIPRIPIGATNFALYGIESGFNPAAAAAGGPAATAASGLDRCQTTMAAALGNTIRRVARVQDGDMTFAQLKAFGTTQANRERYLYAELPDQIYDLPKDIFRRDGTYTILAWAEDNRDNQISPRAEIAFSVQERLDELGILKHNTTIQAPDSADPTGVLAWTISTNLPPRPVDPYKLIDGVRFVAAAGGVPAKCELGTEVSGQSNYTNYLIPDPDRTGEALLAGLTITKK